MRLSLVFAVLVVAAQLGCAKLQMSPSATPSNYAPKQIWTGTSGGYQIAWTTAEISASALVSPQHEAFSEIGRTITDFHAKTRGQRADCDMSRQAVLQSVVGPIISVRTADIMKCANGDNGTARGAHAFDLAHPANPLSLTALIPEHELHALTVKAGQFCAQPPADLMNRFAFSEVHGAVVIIMVTLPENCSSAQLSIAVNVPAKLKQPLALAAARTQGFLGRDQAAISSGLSTTVNYHYRAAVQ